MTASDPVLETAMSLVGGPEAAIRERLGLEAKDAATDVSYGKLRDLVAYQHNAVFPGRVFVRDATVVLIYLSTDLGWLAPTADDLAEAFGTSRVTLRSRAGKSCAHYVSAEDGIAYSADEQGTVLFAEVFAPGTLADYQAEFYEDPGAFIR